MALKPNVLVARKAAPKPSSATVIAKGEIGGAYLYHFKPKGKGDPDSVLASRMDAIGDVAAQQDREVQFVWARLESKVKGFSQAVVCVVSKDTKLTEQQQQQLVNDAEKKLT